MNQKRKISLMLVIILVVQTIFPIVINTKVVAIEDVNIEEEQVVNNSKKEVDTNLQTIKFGSYVNENKDIEENTGEIVKETTTVLENTENISEAYIEWAELSDEEKQKTIQPREEFVDMSVLDSFVTSTSVLQSQYNLRDNINIKTENQSPYGNCYAYAGLNSIETNIALKAGLIYDFSEMHVEYMTSNLLEGNRTLNEGGNFQTVVNYSKDLFGPVLESEISNKKYTEDEYTLLRSAKPIVTITETVEFPTINKRYGYTVEELEEFRNSVKSHIKENGSVYASMYFSESNKYYNNSTKSYCCLDTSIMTNHAVSIIGWDDNFSKDNFPESNRPINNGAWIALNSHGSNFGDNGVFYISYEDNWVEYNMSGVVSTIDLVDTYGPEIELTNYTDENNTVSSTINVYDIGGSGIKAESLKYIWSQSEYEPNIEDFTESFNNGDTLSKTYEDGEKWYLWILAYDNNDNYSIYGAGVVTIKFKDEILYKQIKGVGYDGVKDYIYAYNDETYEVQILKEKLDAITSLSLGILWTTGSSGNVIGGGYDVYLADLSGLEMFKNLQTLSFNAKSGIENIEVLQKLGQLTNLIIKSGLDNIEFIENMNTLQRLTLNEMNDIKDININFPDSIKELKILNCDNIVNINANYPQQLEYLMVRECDKLSNIININFPNSIQEMMLSANAIKDISQVKWPKNLKYLCLTENEMEVVNGANWPDNLEILDLSFNNIEDITKINLPNGLIELYIGDNEIIDISNLKNLVNIELFSAGANYIEDISVIENMTNLKEVFFGSTVWWCYYFYNGYGPYSNLLGDSRDHGNNIKTVNIKWPENLSKLELDNNKIEELENITFSEKITSLDLSYNQINKISINIDNLESIYLNNNNIEDISRITVTNKNTNTNRILNLSNNEIVTIDNTNWEESRIDTLILSNNKINDINNMKWPKDLDSLALDNNNITNIDGVNFGTYLRYLILNYNNISEIKNVTWPSSLEAVEAAGNNITDLSWIESGTNLIAVALNENKINNIQNLLALSKLQELHLNNNNIEDISPLDGLTNLKSLKLQNQEITKVVSDNIKSIGIPQIIKASITEGSKAYTSNATILYNCSIEGENIIFDNSNIGKIYIMIDGGNAAGTMIYITNNESTEDISYKIYNKEDLINIREIINNSDALSNIEIDFMNDIDLGGYYDVESQTWMGEEWTPIGNEKHPFKGILNGNNHKIFGIYINSEKDYQGFIGYNMGIIKNLGIENGYIYTTGNYVGGISGSNEGETTITDCYNKADITGRSSVGGISGYGGKNYENSNIARCYNEGDITGTENVAGILGITTYTTKILECYNSGNITSKGDSAGIITGFTGNGYTTVFKINNCFNLGEINGKSAGGIINSLPIMNSVYQGNITNCYNIGKVSGTQYTGQIKATDGTNGNLKNCYYIESNKTNGIGSADDTENNVYGLSEKYMQTQEFANILNSGNEEDIWKIVVEESYKYPVFVWQTSYPNYVEEQILTEIAVTKAPTNTTYIEGQNFNSAGMKVTATYNDRTSKEVANYTVTDGNNLTLGKTSVTISYTEEGITKTTTQGITVIAKALTGIAITKAPSNTSYIAGQNFNPAGMKVTATYNDESTKEVTNYTVTDGNNLSVGKTSVTISYTENGVTKTTTQGITVTERLQIEIDEYTENKEENDSYIEDISPNTSIEDMISKINTNGQIEIFKGTEKITDKNVKIATGMKIKITLNSESLEYTAVVKGDLTGDGEMGDADLLRMVRYKAGLDKKLTGAHLKATDINSNNEKADDIDLLKLVRILVGLDWF